MNSAVNKVSVLKKMLPTPLRNILRPYWNRILPSEAELRARKIAEVGPAQLWRRVQDHEIGFWDDLLGSTQMPRMNANRGLPAYVTELIPQPGARVEILDVGSGPMTILGDHWRGRDVRITAIDANAAEYDRLLAKHGITPPCRKKFGYAEDLGSIVPVSSFDLVHARNCIDHSKDPLRAIEHMVRAVKPGCCVFLNHYISEGRRNQYAGPHQGNLFPLGGRFFVDRPGMRPVDIGEMLKGRADVTIGSSPHGAEWFTVTIRRRA